MKNIQLVINKITPLGVAVIMLASVSVPTIAFRMVSASALSERSLTVSTTVASDELTAPDGSTYMGLPAGDSRNGQKVTHKYTFKVGDGHTGVTLRGFTLEYCEKAFDFIGQGACGTTALNGLLDGGVGTSFSASAWNGGVVEINGVNFDVEANEANYLTLTSATGIANIDSGDEITIEFVASNVNYFVNPNSAYKNISNGTYFAHIQTFSSVSDTNDAIDSTLDTPDGVIDNGTVASNIANSIGIYTRVQETLNFSVEGDQDGVGGVPNGPSSSMENGCDALTASGQMKMGDNNNALSFSQSYYAMSYFRISTNAANGTNVYYAGDTLRSGSHAVRTVAPPGEAREVGKEQFGVAFDLTDSDEANVGTTGTLVPLLAYSNSANGYAFDATDPTAPKLLAAVADSTIACDTGAVQFVANIAPETPAGIYQTKINYIATPRY